MGHCLSPPRPSSFPQGAPISQEKTHEIRESKIFDKNDQLEV